MSWQTARAKTSIRARVGRLVAAATMILLSLAWAIQALIALNANLAEIDAAQNALAISFSQRLEERLRIFERRLQDTIATLDLVADAESVSVELRRLLRLEPRIIDIRHQDLQWLSSRGEYSAVFPGSSPLVFETRLGQLDLGRAHTPNELGARVPFRLVRRAEPIRGTLSGEFSLSLLSELIAQFESESSSAVYIALEDGTILAHRNQALTGTSRLQLLSKRDQSMLSTMLHPFLGQSWIGRDQFGNRTLIASVKIGGSNWSVFFARPLGRTIERAMNVHLLGLVLLVTAIFSAIAASFWLAQYVTGPIVDLRKAVAAHNDQVEIVRPASVRDDEVGDLYAAFSSLVGEIVSANAKLEQRVIEKTKDLADANTELEVASKHKSEFLAHMSHELRTPLNAVIGFSDLLKAQYFGPLNTKQAEYVRDINASGQHLLSLINDILDLAKVEAGRMDLALSECHVAALVESCAALVSERVSRCEQTLATEVGSEITTWALDERKVKQCLLNLLTNASKFTPSGGAITLRVFIEKDELVVAVSDNGTGIAADDLPKLFSEFYQAKAADTASGVAAQREGTGLGLALTRGFVELHGGTISAESVVGKGSTFTMRFPAAGKGGSVKTVGAGETDMNEVA